MLKASLSARGEQNQVNMFMSNFLSDVSSYGVNMWWSKFASSSCFSHLCNVSVFPTARKTGWYLLLSAICPHCWQADRGHPWGQKPQENGCWRLVRWGELKGCAHMPTGFSSDRAFVCNDTQTAALTSPLLQHRKLFFLFSALRQIPDCEKDLLNVSKYPWETAYIVTKETQLMAPMMMLSSFYSSHNSQCNDNRVDLDPTKISMLEACVANRIAIAMR